MSGQRDEMELKEEAIRAHYRAATEMLMGFDHAPRLGTPRLSLPSAEKSPDIASMQRPGFSAGRRRAARACACSTGSPRPTGTTP